MSVRAPLLVLAALAAGLAWTDDASAQRREKPIPDSSPSCTEVTEVNHSGVLSSGGNVSAVSGATYGSARCPERFILEARLNDLPSPPVYRTHAFAAWADAELPKQSCTFALVSASFYGYKAGGGRNRGGWVDLGTKSAGGRWETGLGNGRCEAGVGIEFDPAQYTKLRVAAKAGTAVGGVKKVRAGVWSYLGSTR